MITAPARNLRIRTLLATTAVALAAVAVSGCNGETPAPPASSPSTAASSAAPSKDQAEAAKALEVYNGLTEKLIALQTAATPDVDAAREQLKAFAVDPLRTQLVLDLRQRRDAKLHNTGRPVWSAKVTKISTEKAPYTATIEDCYDVTNYPLVKADGSPAGVPNQTKKYVVVSTAKVYGDGKWYIETSEADRSRSC